MGREGSTSAGTAYDVIGAGPPVVLVHGLGLRRAMWDWQAPALAADYQVVTYDLIGHGDSALPGATLTMEDFVGQLMALADHLDLTRFALVGFSLGGLISQAMALAHPDRVAALGVLHSAYDRTDAERAAIMIRVNEAAVNGPGATIDAALERWFTAPFAAAHPQVLDQVRQWVKANDRTAYPKAYRVLAEADAALAGTVAAIRCPTLVLTGDEDFGNSPDMAMRMAAAIPTAQCTILSGLRHMALAENPKAVLDALVPFLNTTMKPHADTTIGA